MTLQKVRNPKPYFKLRNEITAMSMEAEYEDSIRRILDIRYPIISLVHHLRKEEEKARLVSNTHCDTFTIKYRNYLQANLRAVKEEAISKKNLYSQALAGEVMLDSTTFSNFIDNYNNGFYDRKLFHYFITRDPELFFLEINLSRVESDVCFCPECFTKEELDEMYCKLKPLRAKNIHKLWMLERHGDLKCQD